VRRYAVAPDRAARLTAEAALRPRGPGSDQTVVVQLWSLGGRVLLAVGAS